MGYLPAVILKLPFTSPPIVPALTRLLSNTATVALAVRLPPIFLPLRSITAELLNVISPSTSPKRITTDLEPAFAIADAASVVRVIISEESVSLSNLSLVASRISAS